MYTLYAEGLRGFFFGVLFALGLVVDALGEDAP